MLVLHRHFHLRPTSDRRAQITHHGTPNTPRTSP
jgi:hypothetical protein